MQLIFEFTLWLIRDIRHPSTVLTFYCNTKNLDPIWWYSPLLLVPLSLKAILAIQIGTNGYFYLFYKISWSVAIDPTIYLIISRRSHSKVNNIYQYLGWSYRKRKPILPQNYLWNICQFCLVVWWFLTKIGSN